MSQNLGVQIFLNNMMGVKTFSCSSQGSYPRFYFLFSLLTPRTTSSMLLSMRNSFKDDTALTDRQMDLILSRYDQVKDLPLHKELVGESIRLIERQDNRALFVLFDQGFKTLGPLYPLVLIFTLFPTVSALYERLGITESVRKATLSDIAIWVKTYEKQNQGITGLDRYGWVCRHLCAKVLSLGRLQFEQGFFRFPYSIYFDTKRKLYRTFAQGGLMCGSGGYIGVEDGETDSWTTTYSISDAFLSAHEVDQEKGCISREAVSVLLSDLKPISSPEKPAILVHIPEGGPLTPSLVDASFALAQAMFSPTLFVCDSWLLDPELAKVLPSESNICRFMRRFKKFPVSFSTPQIYERVFTFGATRTDVLTWTSTTSLQKRVQDHIRRGGIFRTMGGYVPLPNDL